MEMKISTIVAFVIYFVAMLGIGFVFMRGQKEEKEYFLGGRKMGPWVTAMSAQASDMSGWLLMGFPGSILAFGMGKVWIGIGLALGTALNWIFVAKRLRNFSAAANDSITLPQYLRNRFATESKVLQIICAVVFLVFFTVYVASSFAAGERVFSSIVPALAEHKTIALLIFAVIIIAYTFSGGFKAVCWTDFFQGILMLVALLAVPIMMLASSKMAVGSVQPMAILSTDPMVTGNFSLNPFSKSWQDVISGLAWGLGYFGMPHILVRFMSIRKAKEVKKSATVAIIWVVLTLGAAIVIALIASRTAVGNDLVKEFVAHPEDGKSYERIFIEIVKTLFPGFVAGILLSAIIAAAMSTADSQLLVASSSFTSDIYKPVFRKNASDKEVLWVGRGVVALVAIVAFFIANSGLNNEKSFANSIMDMVEYAWGGFGAAFGPVIILSLFWKRFTYKGAIAGVVGGAVVDVLWAAFLSETNVYELAPGFLAGLLCAVLVTLVDKKPSDEVVAIYERGVKGEE